MVVLRRAGLPAYAAGARAGHLRLQTADKSAFAEKSVAAELREFYETNGLSVASQDWETSHELTDFAREVSAEGPRPANAIAPSIRREKQSFPTEESFSLTAGVCK